MKIKNITLHGFKSFPDRTEVDFHEGVTAIVGPNGCGKSNISDAIKWVLGEQRPTAIRGTRMEEAIFEGTVERKPIHRAEVSLVLSNEDRLLPVPYDEVTIGRTVFRGGESEYRLNGEVCRLKDIRDLCRDTGLGANAYSVIENRMIDSILSDRAEERRSLFEEAAEISRYKDRRRTALRRLEQAEEDLERLEDLLGEVRTKVRSLAQQRGRAERYEEYRERRLQLEIAVAEARLADVDERLEKAEAELEEMKAEEPADRSLLSQRETEAESLRVEISEAERRRSDVADRLQEVRDEVEEAERGRLVAEERAGAAEERLQTVGEELSRLDGREEELREELERLNGRIEDERSRLDGLREERATAEREVRSLREEREREKAAEEEAVERVRELRGRVGMLRSEVEAAAERAEERRSDLERRERELEAARSAAREQREIVERLESELEEARRETARLDERADEATARVEEEREALAEVRRRVSALEGEVSAERERVGGLEALVGSGDEHPAAVSALLESGEETAGVIGVLADFLDVPAERARAVEAHLGPYLHAVLVEDWEAVRSVGEWLRGREEKEGIVLLPVEPGPREVAAGRAAGELAEAVGSTEPASDWAQALLGGVTLEDSAELTPRSRAWTSEEGTGQDRHGAVRLGAPGWGRGVLRRRGELRAARKRLAEARAKHRETVREAERRETELEGAEARSADVAERLSAARDRVRTLESERETAEHRLRRAREEAGQLEERIEELEAGLREAREAREGAEERLEDAEKERADAEEEAAERRAELLEAEADADQARDSLRELELRVAREEADLRSLGDRRDRTREALEETVERREALEEERAEKRDAIAEASRAASDSQEDLADLLERRAELEAELREQEGRLATKREELEQRETWLKEARRSEREQSERRHELELQVAELRGKRANVRERIEAEWDAQFDELTERVDPPAEGGPAEWSRQLEEVKSKLKRLGPVNLLAAREYEEEKERLDFLEGQRDDLVQAREDLEDSIRRINRAAAQAFNETFEEIRENFQRTFSTLFEGGECDVWLDDPDDPLDSPVEISASPRGKRTQRIHLLSGGERALTALALLFGIYLAKPSPFCVMDEVDAPLDESNVDRFTAMLDRFKEDTQFVVITHNPRTIASADWVYGVTMQEPGVSSVVGVDFEDLPAGQVA